MPDHPEQGMSSPAGDTFGRFLSPEPVACAECGAQINAGLQADACQICGAPRCQQCASALGDMGSYICPMCAADAKDSGLA